MQRSPRRPAYTLLEVMLVMAIMVILLAVSMPTMNALYGDTRVRGAADEVRGAWAEARSRAIDAGMPYRFAVMKDKEVYRIAPDSPEYWDGSKGDSEHESDDGKDKVGMLPKGIKFDPATGTPTEGGWANVATFLPDGTCKSDAHVEIREGNDPLSLTVSVRALNGSVSVKTKKQLEEEDR